MPYSRSWTEYTSPAFNVAVVPPMLADSEEISTSSFNSYKQTMGRRSTTAQRRRDGGTTTSVAAVQLGTGARRRPACPTARQRNPSHRRQPVTRKTPKSITTNTALIGQRRCALLTGPGSTAHSSKAKKPTRTVRQPIPPPLPSQPSPQSRPSLALRCLQSVKTTVKYQTVVQCSTLDAGFVALRCGRGSACFGHTRESTKFPCAQVTAPLHSTTGVHPSVHHSTISMHVRSITTQPQSRSAGWEAAPGTGQSRRLQLGNDAALLTHATRELAAGARWSAATYLQTHVGVVRQQHLPCCLIGDAPRTRRPRREHLGRAGRTQHRRAHSRPHRTAVTFTVPPVFQCPDGCHRRRQRTINTGRGARRGRRHGFQANALSVREPTVAETRRAQLRLHLLFPIPVHVAVPTIGFPIAPDEDLGQGTRLT